MPFYIRQEKFCETCGFPLDQCECLAPDKEEAESMDAEIRDEDYL